MSSAATETVSFQDVLEAAQRIEPLAQHTPVETSRHFNAAAGVKAYFKCENLQRGGSFKIRGATNFILSLTPQERRRGVVTYSSGNHAQAVAIAAAYAGVQATIVMPTDAPKAKLSSTQSYGPKIVLFDRLREHREEIAGRIAAETGAIILPSYDHPRIIAGQGTAALELMEDVPDLDAIFVCLGGGGLLSGTLTVVQELNPKTHVFGVEPELANDWFLSLQRGERVGIDPPPTIADGLRTQIPGHITFPIIKEFSSGVLLVSEEEIKETMRFLLTRMKLLVEPSGAVAAAAVLHKKIPAGLEKAGILLSGGNVDLDVLAGICAEAA